MDGISINGNNGTDRTFVVGNLIGTRPNGASGFPNGRLGIDLNNGTRALLNGNVISGHGTGLRLWGTSARPMSNLINGEALPTGGPALDSRDNCITGNSAGTQVVYNGAGATTFLFENNWWGAANGPGGAGGGSGDPVAPEMDVTPFLTSAPSGCAVTPVADLSIAITLPAPVHAGETVTVSATVENAGPDPAAAATLQIALPEQTTITPPAGCAAGGPGIECPLPGIASGASLALEFDLALPPTARGTLSFTASVVSATLDPVAGNNSLIVERDIVAEADLGLTLSNASDPLVEGEITHYLLRIENAGPAQVDAAQVSLPAPSGLLAPRRDPSARGLGAVRVSWTGERGRSGVGRCRGRRPRRHQRHRRWRQSGPGDALGDQGARTAGDAGCTLGTGGGGRALHLWTARRQPWSQHRACRHDRAGRDGSAGRVAVDLRRRRRKLQRNRRGRRG
jgi:uncharacterized repeat protein (TIGR01451 family)